MQPWLKAGLIGAAVLLVLNLVGLVPCIGLITCLLGIVAYVVIGALAAYWMPPTRDPGRGAGQGALAAVIAALVGGLVNWVLLTVQATALTSEQLLSALPPETLQQLEAAGLDIAMFDRFAGPAGGVLTGSLCCAGGIVLAAILGAIGGAVFAGVKPE
jgi:hypothetical protein